MHNYTSDDTTKYAKERKASKHTKNDITRTCKAH